MSSTFTELWLVQQTTAKWIKNIIINTDQSTKKPKQTAGYSGNRLDILTGYWDDFTKTHHSWMRYSEFEESEYAKQDQYEATLEDYVTNKAELQQR